MTFATATIQGYVTFLKASTTPSNRSVVNMYIAVPVKRQNGTTSNTYKISVWDNQALAAAQYIDPDKKPLVTVSGQLTIDEYSAQNPNSRGEINPMMRLDFASILDYGSAKRTQEDIINNAPTSKQNFHNFIEKVEETKIKAEATKKKVASK